MLHKYYANITIKYKDGVEPLTILSNGDWIDLRCAEDTHMRAGEFKYIPLGVAMEMPIGCEAIVVPRSSTFAKYGIIQANSIGGTSLRLLCVTPLSTRMTVYVSSVCCLTSHLSAFCRWRTLATLTGAD